MSLDGVFEWWALYIVEVFVERERAFGWLFGERKGGVVAQESCMCGCKQARRWPVGSENSMMLFKLAANDHHCCYYCLLAYYDDGCLT